MKINSSTYSDFCTNGFTIIKLENLEPINRMRSRLQENITDFLLRNLNVKPDYLENNKLSDNDYSNLLQQINQLNINLADFKIICDNLDSLFKPVLGENIACAKTPRIRFVQREESRVAFGMHSDTFYGDSFFDIAIWMQLTPDISTPSIKVIPGSHIPFEGKYTVKDGENNWNSKFIKGKNIGLAYVPLSNAALGSRLEIDIRGRRAPIELVKVPFYQRKRS